LQPFAFGLDEKFDALASPLRKRSRKAPESFSMAKLPVAQPVYDSGNLYGSSF